MINFSNFNSLYELVSYFDSEEMCEQAIIEQRWGDDVVCPYCGKHHCIRYDGKRFHCTNCRNKFSILVGSIFENTKLPLIKWFMAMYLISSHKKGISSHQLGRDIDVTQNTAWHILQKIRRLFPQDDSTSLSGTVECDEVYIGGKEKWKHNSMRTPHTQGRSTKTKTPVFGMVERSYIINAKGDKELMSYVRAIAVEKTDKATLQPIIEQFVDKHSIVMTDELNAYNGIEQLGYTHYVVKHNEAEYAKNDVFTNSIEGFWSHFRRMITGCYHDVSDEHLQQYIDEAVYRWNTRKMDESQRFIHMFRLSLGLVVPWRELELSNVS